MSRAAVCVCVLLFAMTLPDVERIVEPTTRLRIPAV